MVQTVLHLQDSGSEIQASNRTKREGEGREGEERERGEERMRGTGREGKGREGEGEEERQGQREGQ